jgi:FKBP-type peptidyl-prolyl cis-trans isomerase SlyD
MSIKQDSVVTLHYTLRDDDGEVLESSAGGDPMAYLHGHGNLIPGLERELEGKQPGEKLQVSVAPADAYGEYDEQLVSDVPLSAMEGITLEVGMRLQAETEHGPQAFTVTQIEGESVKLDANHPLAGRTLNFEVEITDVREASREELEHGHVHGEGGHH